MIFLAYFKEKNHNFQFCQVGFVLNNYTWDIGYNELSNNIHVHESCMHICSGFIHQKV